MKRVLGSEQVRGLLRAGGEQRATPPERVRRVLATGLACGLVLGGLVACGGDADDDDDNGGVDAPAFAEEFSVAGALAELPVAGVDLEVAMVSVGDLDAASEASGLERPADDSREAWNDWVMPITGQQPNSVLLPLGQGFNHQAASPEEFAEVAGWSVNDTSAFAEISAPPHQLTVVTGLDDDVLADSLVDTGDGIRSTRQGEDFAVSPGEPSAVDQLGRPVRFQQDGSQVGFGTSTPLVKAWASDGATLADNDSWVAVADMLDDEDVVSAVLATAPGGGLAGAMGGRMSPEQLAQMQEEHGLQVPEDPFDVIGIGWDAEGEVHIAYHFSDADAAKAGADVLETSWRDGSSVATMRPVSDLVTFEEADVEGSVAVITVVPVDERAIAPWQMLQQREIVFVSP